MVRGECNNSLWKERHCGRRNWQSDRDSWPMFVGGKVGWRTTTGTGVCDELEATGRASPDTDSRLLSCLQTSSHALVRQIGCSMYRRLLAESDSTYPKLHPGDRIPGRFAGSVPGSKAAAKDHATRRAPRMSSACAGRKGATKRREPVGCCHGRCRCSRSGVAAFGLYRQRADGGLHSASPAAVNIFRSGPHRLRPQRW
jgi:hypothetical protein